MERKQMEEQLILKGLYKLELLKKTDEEISLLYQKVVLRGLSPEMAETIGRIKILCGDTEKLRSSLVGGFCSYSRVKDMTEEELQRLAIENMGIDAVVKGAKTMKEKGLDKGLSHKYGNTLQAMRGERGKRIYEHVKKLPRDEKEKYLKSCSELAVEDARAYKSAIKNLDKVAETIAVIS